LLPDKLVRNRHN